MNAPEPKSLREAVGASAPLVAGLGGLHGRLVAPGAVPPLLCHELGDGFLLLLGFNSRVPATAPTAPVIHLKNSLGTPIAPVKSLFNRRIGDELNVFDRDPGS